MELKAQRVSLAGVKALEHAGVWLKAGELRILESRMQRLFKYKTPVGAEATWL